MDALILQISDTDDAVDAVLLSLSNPWSDESEGNLDGAAHNSYCLQAQSQPHCGAQPHSCCPGQGPSWGISHHSAGAGRLADLGDES